ncbi:hypothetical protein [Leptolyngbya iicbica]|uniref:Uncharacterized protein n=2 Tax=Cyanophyceae TaxID=3028117 RepID=A0A4Q7E582_9CYAN|nr:hypothetical protein [Leptolyngbya sp. LK]RZM77199.1 hypothetical protein DYY88_16260 [Leptolyngbya sp. LK]
MRSLYWFLGVGLMGVGTYLLSRNILLTTHPYSWWRGMAADLSGVCLCVGLFMAIWFRGEARVAGGIAIGFGIVFIFFNSRIVLSPTSLWQFCLAFGSMSLGYKLLTTQHHSI